VTLSGSLIALSFYDLTVSVFSPLRRPPSSPPFPYTTLFRSVVGHDHDQGIVPAGVLGQLAQDDVELLEALRGHLGATGILTGRRSESTRLNSSHVKISYAVFCLKKKKKPHACSLHDVGSRAD